MPAVAVGSKLNVSKGTSCQKNQTEFEGSCYFRLCALQDFEEATAACKSYDASLVSIDSERENELVRDMCGINSCRIGLSKLADKEKWVWPDGTSVGMKYEWTKFVNWNEGEPNNWGGRNEDAAVMNINNMVSSLRKTYLFRTIKPLFDIWLVLQVALPIILLVGACMAYRCHSACIAQVVCIITGVASIGLALEIILWLSTIRKVNDNWPEGSKTLLVSLACFGSIQICICCMATAKAQELQWATSVGWNSMGARAVSDDLNNAGISLSAELRSAEVRTMPGV